jgi:hypothetical protein
MDLLQNATSEETGGPPVEVVMEVAGALADFVRATKKRQDEVCRLLASTVLRLDDDAIRRSCYAALVSIEENDPFPSVPYVFDYERDVDIYLLRKYMPTRR